MLTSYSVCIMILYVIYGYDAAIGDKFLQNSFSSILSKPMMKYFHFVNKSIFYMYLYFNFCRICKVSAVVTKFDRP